MSAGIEHRARARLARMGDLIDQDPAATVPAGQVARELQAVVLGPSAPGGVCVLCGSGVLASTGEHIDPDAPPCLGRTPHPVAPDEVTELVESVIAEFADQPERFAGDVVARLRAGQFRAPTPMPDLSEGARP